MTTAEARCRELEKAIDDLHVTIKRLSDQVRDGWPRCTCGNCWMEPSEASSDQCDFVKAYDLSQANAAEISAEIFHERRKLGLDYPHDDTYVGSRDRNKRFDGSM